MIFAGDYYIIGTDHLRKDEIMKAGKTSRIVRIVISALLILLILASLTGIFLFSAGVRNADQTGTFNLFGRSYHLNKSAAMSPNIEKNDLIVVRHMPFSSLREGDLMAFYMEEDGKEHLLVRRIQSIQGITYTVTDNADETLELSADTCRILGKATSKSAALGKAVIFLQTSEGRMIFFGWTIGITLLLLGLTILIHLLWKLLTGKAAVPPGPVDALTGQPLSFDEPISLEKSGKHNK